MGRGLVPGFGKPVKESAKVFSGTQRVMTVHGNTHPRAVKSMKILDFLAAGSGLLLTLILGSFCGLFLKRTVTVELPSRFEVFRVPAETAGGGRQLGTLERVLFFGSFWASAYVLIVGWLAFKVAAKWAAWQHVTKLPEAKDDTLEDHLKLSSRLLGRFMNGVFTTFSVLRWVPRSQKKYFLALAVHYQEIYGTGLSALISLLAWFLSGRCSH